MFIRGNGDWIEYRNLPGVVVVDFHFAKDKEIGEGGSYWESMDAVHEITLNALRREQAKGTQYVLFTHGHSTSRNGKQTSRSVIRGIMRSKEATPYIIRRESIQHYSAFVAKLRPPAVGGSVKTKPD